MTSVIPIHALSEIAENYDAIICDVWGVIHNGAAPFVAAHQALSTFREMQGPVLLLSNAPRPADNVVAMLDGMNVPRAAYDGVLTSGDASRNELARRGALPFYHIGPSRNACVYEGLSARPVKLDEAALVLCTGLFDEEWTTLEQHAATLTAARARKLPMICANPDIKVHVGPQLVWCAGALAQNYQALGGEVLHLGKPHLPIYGEAIAMLEKLKGEKLERPRILAIGDAMATDILGANRAGIDALLITSGINADRFGPSPDAPELARVKSALDDSEVYATAYMPRLKW